MSNSVLDCVLGSNYQLKGSMRKTTLLLHFFGTEREIERRHDEEVWLRTTHLAVL